MEFRTARTGEPFDPCRSARPPEMNIKVNNAVKFRRMVAPLCALRLRRKPRPNIWESAYEFPRL